MNANPYLMGPYAPVDDERTDLDLRVLGTLPPELNTLFVQDSPNPRLPPRGAYHWFDGDGMVHGVHIQGGRASYRNRWIQTQGLAEELAANQALYPGIMMPFEPGQPKDKDTANTDLVFHNGKLLALWWLGGAPYHLSVPELETVGKLELPCGVAAHAKTDPRTGELIFFDYDPYEAPYMRYGVLDAQGALVTLQDAELPRPALLHDLHFTERYTILMDFPMWWDVDKLAQGKRRVRFDGEQPARFGIVPRRGGTIRWFEAPGCYCYHAVNAWEEGDTVVLHACRIQDPVPRLRPEDEPDVPRLAFLRMEPYLHEWRFDMKTGAVSERRLSDTPTEFPRANDSRLGVETRYSWHPRVAREGTLLFDACVKMGGPEEVVHTYGEGCVGGETVFVPRPGATDEDDGWVLAFVTDRPGEQSEVRVLDGATMDLVARILIPRRVPIGFHAHHVEPA